MQTNPAQTPETTVPKYVNMYEQIGLAAERDYAGAQSNPFKGIYRAHKALIASTFDQSKWDALFINAAQRFLSEFKDRQLRLQVKDGAHYQNRSVGFRVRHFDGALYVTEVSAEKRLTPGDKIVALDGKPFPEKYQAVKNWLYNDAPEREIWTGVLKTIRAVTVAHQNGRNEDLTLGAYPPEVDRYDNALRWLNPGTVYLKLQNELDEEEIAGMVAANRGGLAASRKLILDLRRNIGGSEKAFYPLLPYLLVQPASIAELKDRTGVYTNYSARNCDYQIEHLRRYLSSDDQEQVSLVNKMIADLKDKRGAGFLFEEDVVDADEQSLLAPINPEQKVILLADTYCENAGETFVEICTKLPKVTILGRPTMGCTDYSNLVVRPMSGRFTFIYPMSRSAKLDRGQGINGKGIAVDQYLPWSPAECEQDVLLEKALNF